MRNILKFVPVALLCLFIISFYSCRTGMVSESKGKAQEAYLELMQTQTKYHEGVEVIIDNNQPFHAKVDKETRMGVRGNVYAIPTGKRHLVVKCGDRVLVNKDIFSTSQETKQILLP